MHGESEMSTEMEAGMDWPTIMSWSAIVLGFASAAAWLRSSTVKITLNQAMAMREKERIRTGRMLSVGYATLDGWDMQATFAAQARWNSLGALLAASSITIQAISQVVDSV